MNALLALLTVASVVAGSPAEDVYPIAMRPEHGAISWTVSGTYDLHRESSRFLFAFVLVPH